MLMCSALVFGLLVVQTFGLPGGMPGYKKGKYSTGADPDLCY